MMKTYSRINMDTAICIWDWYVLDANESHPISKIQADQGTPAARDAVIELTEAVDTAYKLAYSFVKPKEPCPDLEPFDFQFVPWFMENCLNADASLRADWGVIVRRKFDAALAEPLGEFEINRLNWKY